MSVIYISRNKLKAAAYFSPVDDFRLSLNGILIESTPIQTRVVATDGLALFCAKDDSKGNNVDNCVGIVPIDTVKQILSWKAQSKGAASLPVVITTLDNPAEEYRAEWAGNVAIFQMIAMTFPNYRLVVPTDVSGEASNFDPELLMRCKKAAEALGRKEGLYDFKQGGNSPAIAVFSSEAFAVVMPMRGEKADVAEIAWGREAVPK